MELVELSDSQKGSDAGSENMFSLMASRRLGQGGDVPVEDYLEIARVVSDFLGKSCKSDRFKSDEDLRPGSLGRSVYLVKRDVDGNVAKIRDLEPPGDSTVKSLAAGEAFRGNGRGVDAVLWLNRGLEFCCGFVARFLEDLDGDRACDVRRNLQEAYEEVLQEHHGWIVRKAAKVGPGPNFFD